MFVNGQSGTAPASPSKQAEKMRALSSPSRQRREKVVTEGISKGTIDWVIHYSKQSPGPGSYKVDQASKALLGPTGGRFSKSNPLSEVDRMVMDAKTKPGPGHYKLKDLGDSGQGRKFSTANPITEVDRMVLEAKHKPGPGAYGPLLVDEKGKKMLGEAACTMSKSKPMSDVDWVMKRSKEVPGPGEYHLPGTGDGVAGGSFSTANPKSSIDWAVHESNSKPGPGQYAINDNVHSGGKFSVASPMSEVDRLVLDAKNKPGPGQYDIQDHLTRKVGHTGKFPFVYRPKDPSKAHLTKGGCD
jgi:hypothetical protein